MGLLHTIFDQVSTGIKKTYPVWKSLSDFASIREKVSFTANISRSVPTDSVEESFQHIHWREAEGHPIRPELDPPEAVPRQDASNMEAASTVVPSQFNTDDTQLTHEYSHELSQSTTPAREEDYTVQSPPNGDLRFMVAKEKLVEQQKDVSAKRLQVRESRLALRYKREEEAKLRLKLKKNIDSLLSNYNLPHELLQDFELLQVATQEYLSLEQRYHQEEDHLEVQEYMFTQAMENFEDSAGRDPLEDAEGLLEPVNEDHEYGIFQDSPRCVVNYLSRIGEERILQERLSDLDAEWSIATERQQQRRQLQLGSDEISEEFLRTFDKQWARIREDLNIVQFDVNELRIICLDQGYRGFDYEDLNALRPYGEDRSPQPEEDPLKIPEDESFFYDEKSPEAIEQSSDISPDDQDVDPLEKSPVNNIFFFRELEKREDFGSTEYVNKWMLHQLRVSSMGIWQLQLLHEWQTLRDKGWQNRDIRVQALDIWFDDEAGKVQPSNPSYIIDDDSQASSLKKDFVTPSLRSHSESNQKSRRGSVSV